MLPVGKECKGVSMLELLCDKETWQIEKGGGNFIIRNLDLKVHSVECSHEEMLDGALSGAGVRSNAGIEVNVSEGVVENSEDVLHGKLGFALIGNKVEHGTPCLIEASKKGNIDMGATAVGKDWVVGGHQSVRRGQVTANMLKKRGDLVVCCVVLQPCPERRSEITETIDGQQQILEPVAVNGAIRECGVFRNGRKWDDWAFSLPNKNRLGREIVQHVNETVVGVRVREGEARRRRDCVVLSLRRSVAMEPWSVGADVIRWKVKEWRWLSEDVGHAFFGRGHGDLRRSGDSSSETWGGLANFRSVSWWRRWDSRISRSSSSRVSIRWGCGELGRSGDSISEAWAGLRKGTKWCVCVGPQEDRRGNCNKATGHTKTAAYFALDTFAACFSMGVTVLHSSLDLNCTANTRERDKPSGWISHHLKGVRSGQVGFRWSGGIEDSRVEQPRCSVLVKELSNQDASLHRRINGGRIHCVKDS